MLSRRRTLVLMASRWIPDISAFSLLIGKTADVVDGELESVISLSGCLIFIRPQPHALEVPVLGLESI